MRMAATIAVATGLAIAAAPASAAEVADASCPGPATSNRFAGQGDVRFAQTFTAQHSGTLTTVQLGVLVTGTAADWEVRILATSGGVPVSSGGVLASTTVDDATVPMSGQITVHPSPPPLLVAGQQYAVAVTRPGSDSIGVLTVTGDPCPGDFFIAGPDPNSFGMEGSDHEMVFSAFVTPPEPPQPPSSAQAGPTGQRAAALAKCKKKKRAKARRKCRKRAKKLPA